MLHPFKAAWSSLLLVSLVRGQVSPPTAPQSVVVEHAKQVKQNSDSSACERACASIAEAIPHAHHLKGEGDCTLWDSKQKDLIPACSIEPSTPEEVSIILKTVAEEKCHFAIRGGGHSRIAGSSNAEGGITIDLKNFNQIEVAKDGKTVKIGGGNTWGNVYKALEKQDLAVVGGRVSDVGVGGLILGGGISFLSNRYGWAADSISAFEVVLPDASIKTITYKSDPDLYWALRGGGNNFGVVTAFHSELIKRKPNLWRGMSGYTFDKVDQLVDAMHNFVTKEQANDPDAVGWQSFCYNVDYDILMAVAILIHCSHSDNSTWPAAFSAWESLESMPEFSNKAVKPMSALTDEIESLSPPGQRAVYKAITYRSDPEVDRQILAVYSEQIQNVKTSERVQPCIVFHPTPSGHTSPMSKNGGNPLGIAGEGPLTIAQTSWVWKNKEDDAVNIKANEVLFEKATKIAKDAGKFIPFIYQNYAWEDQDVFAGYGEENLARLRAIQKRIDPDGVFAGGEGLSRGYFKLNIKKSSSQEKPDANRDEL